MKYKITNIKWDSDEIGLPAELIVELSNNDDIDADLADEISNISGWTHYGFDYVCLDTNLND